MERATTPGAVTAAPTGAATPKTEASWAAFPNMSCIDLALDPNDAGHFILVRITRGLHVWETTAVLPRQKLNLPHRNRPARLALHRGAS